MACGFVSQATRSRGSHSEPPRGLLCSVHETDPLGGGKFQARLSWIILSVSSHASLSPSLKLPFAVIFLLFSRNLADLKMGLGGRVLFPMCARRERLCLNLMRRYLSQLSDESVLGHGCW